MKNPLIKFIRGFLYLRKYHSAQYKKKCFPFELRRHEPNSIISSYCTVCIYTRVTKARPVQRKRNVFKFLFGSFFFDFKEK